MGRGRDAVVGVAAMLLVGCARPQLSRTAVTTASMVMETEYRMVLDNVAMVADNPSALPWHIRIKAVTVRVSDEKGVGDLTVRTGSSPGFGGPHAVRTAEEQWEAEPVTDPPTVKRLQDVYRAALGMAALPDPAYLARDGEERGAVVLSRDVPVGWFRTGVEEDVPEDAAYIGHYRGRYAWVPREELEGFDRFTLVVLQVVRGRTRVGGP